jgi:outer membrane protein assembly factor BamD (BamD/ComL family)
MDQEMQFLLADSLFRKMRETADGASQKELAVQAKPLLLGLLNTTYQDKVLLPLAEIHRELKEPKEASPLYLMLADKMPLQKEELLLQAAALQLEFDPPMAIASFQKVVDLGGSKAPEAAYQELLLLFRGDHFSDLVARAPNIEMHLSTDQKPLYEFCLARSYFKLEQLPEAVDHFQVFIEKESESTPYKRAAYLTLIHCAQKTENHTLFDQVLAQFLNDFPRDDEAGKALLLHTQTALQKGDIAQASHDLDKLVRDFPNFPDQETLLYDQAVLLSKTQQWGASRSAFISFLGKFPFTPHAHMIWASIVHSSIQELKDAQDADIRAKKDQLAADLVQALTVPGLFSLDEEASYQFLLGQLMFDLSHFAQSIAELDRFCKAYPEHPSVPEAYLLQALSHHELKSPAELFIPAAEQALATSRDLARKTALRLHLFNTYLEGKQFDKAADNLYQTFIVEGASIQQENQLWLATYYLTKDKERAIDVLKKALLAGSGWDLHFDPAQTYLEAEALKLASLLNPVEKEQVLSSLINIQNTHQTLPWKNHGNALLALARVHMDLHKMDEALVALETILAKDVFSSSLHSMALLEKSRILLARCQGVDRHEESQAVRAALSAFKDLQIQKVLVNEPVHLEAALDYADLRIALSPDTSRLDSAIFYLTRVKEDFNAKSDPASQEYHEARLRYPEKDRLFQNYMKCVEAEILCWEAKEQVQKNDLVEAGQLKEVATALLNEVLQDTEVTPYLTRRIQERLAELQ